MKIRQNQTFEKSPFNDLFELSNDGLFIADSLSGKILKVNNQMLQLTERNAQELSEQTFFQLTKSHKQQEIVKLLDRTIELGEIQSRTIFIARRDATFFPCELKLKLIGENEVLGILRDVSDKMRALEDIHLRNVAIANVSSGVTIADARQPDLPLIYVNRGFQEITGYSAKEAVGRSCRFLQGDDRDQPQLDVLRESLRKGVTCTVRLRNYRKDGTLFYNELHISPVRNELEELTHFVGIQLDVTDREKARVSLERSEAKYRHLANAVDDLIIQRTIDGRITFSSSASIKMIGRSPSNLLNENLFDLIYEEDRESLKIHSEKLISQETPRSTIFRLTTHTGEFRWFESRDNVFAPESDQDHPLIISVLRDITKRKLAEQEAAQALQREKDMNEMKTRFISMVSHEFRTPMTSVQASASLLREYEKKLTPEKKDRHYNNIEISLKRMNRLLNEVLFFSRAESGKLQVHCQPLCLYEYTCELIESLSPAFPDRSIQLIFSPHKAQQYFLDVHLLDHIFQNLLSNALKYSKLNDKVIFKVDSGDHELIFSVIDKGIGIPAVDQSKLFEAFHRAKNVGTTQGTGLGLNIALRAVELLQGKISFNSTESRGSTFTVTIPIQKV